MNSRGRAEYTNNVADNPTPPPKNLTPVPPPAETTPRAPATPGNLQEAIAAIAKPGPAEAVGAPPKTTEEIGALAIAIALQHGVDPDLVAAVIRIESNYDQYAVSPKGARGLMQLIPATGQRFGVQNLFDARDNIQGGVRYLRFLLEKFEGNIDLSLAAYNAGEGTVERLGKVPPIDETREYVNKIRSLYPKKSALLIPLPVSADSIEKLAAAPEVSAEARLIPAGLAQAAASPSALPSAAVQTSQSPAVFSDEPRIFSRIDARGVSHFSNAGPLD